MRRERAGHTLQTTALVNEAYLRLVDATHARWHDRLHFFAIAAQTMRRVLVDAARSRGYLKRLRKEHERYSEEFGGAESR
jgi:ECF sigma factor